MSLPIQPPSIPSPPAEYDRQYMTQLVAAITNAVTLLNVQGPIRASTINISDLPTNATGLSLGDLFLEGTVVHVVTEAHIFFTMPFAAVGEVGAVTTTP